MKPILKKIQIWWFNSQTNRLFDAYLKYRQLSSHRYIHLKEFNHQLKNIKDKLQGGYNTDFSTEYSTQRHKAYKKHSQCLQRELTTLFMDILALQERIERYVHTGDKR